MLSTTMSRVSTSVRTGRTMSKPGSIRQRAGYHEEKRSSSRESCEDFSTAYIWTTATCSSGTNLEIQYESKSRQRIGFTLEELKTAGIPRKFAPTIGISVDHRRKIRSLEEFQANVLRLKFFKNKLLVFPRRARKFKAGDSSAEELADATQAQGGLPIVTDAPTVSLLKVTNYMTAFKVYEKIRFERMNERQVGERMKKAAEAEKEEK